MGLDQYLEARVSLFRGDSIEREQYNKILEALGFAEGEINEGAPWITVSLPLASWRKANQVHEWFVQNVQNGNDDCGDYYVSDYELKELKGLCEEVLENPEKADEILPVSSGLFFGSDKYDEYYFEQLRDTIEIIDKALDNEALKGYDLFYTSSW